MFRRLAMLLALASATAALAAPGPAAVSFNEFEVELPADIRKMAGRGKLSPVARARVTIAVPAGIDTARSRPVLIVSATSDPGYNSSRDLLHAYAASAIGSGWIVVAADPAQTIAVEEDDVLTRWALNLVALAVLELKWPAAVDAPLAFGGFSGGAKYSSWLAAAFASQGRRIIGIYLAGINQATLVDAATQFDVLTAAFRRIPVFMLAGERDKISTPAAHRDVAAKLEQAGFENVRLEYFSGAHVIEPGPLGAALDWFRELAPPLTGK